MGKIGFDAAFSPHLTLSPEEQGTDRAQCCDRFALFPAQQP